MDSSFRIVASGQTIRQGVNLRACPLLGSCTMKYNSKRNERIAALPGMAHIHPYQPNETIGGLLELLYAVQEMLGEISGLPGVSLQPAAGAQGELAALMIAAAHFRDSGQTRHITFGQTRSPCGPFAQM